MELTTWDVYLIVSADSFWALSLALTIILSFVSTIGFIMIMANSKDNKTGCEYYHKGKRLLKFSLPICFIFLLLTAFIPRTTSLAAIYVIPQIANSKFVQNVPKQITEFTEKWLDKQIKNIESTSQGESK